MKKTLRRLPTKDLQDLPITVRNIEITAFGLYVLKSFTC